MSSRQLTEWLAFVEVEGPFGEERDDMRAALIASTFANAFRGRRQRPFEVKDFMPQFSKPPRRRKTQDETKAYLAGLTLAMGGHVDESILKELRGEK